MIINAVSYARFSSNNQREASIEIQQEHINRYCKDNGITIIKEYVDRAFSATNDNRPQFQQMIKDAESGLFSYVVVYNSSRFARNLQDHLRYRSILESYGIRIISVNENFDETTPEGDLMSNFMMSINQYYSKDLGRKTYLGCLETAKECKHVGGVPPYGYGVDKDQKYYIIEDEAKAVRIIFEMIAKGHTHKEVVQKLESLGIKTRKGKKFKADFTTMLRNRKYMGEFVWNIRRKSPILNRTTPDVLHEESDVVRIPNGIPAIVSQELFYIVQRRLEKNNGKHLDIKKRNYLLSSVIKCGNCGFHMYVDRDANGNGKRNFVRYNYRCYSKSKGRFDCDTKDIRIDQLDTYITNLLFGVLLNDRYSKNIYRLIREKLGHEYERIKKSLVNTQIEIDKTKREIQNLISTLAEARPIAYQEIVKEVERLTTRKNDLESRMQLLRNEMEEYPIFNEGMIQSNQLKIKSLIKNRTVEYLRTAVRLLIKEIVITNEEIETKVNLNAYISGNTTKDLEIGIVEESENVRDTNKQLRQRLNWGSLVIRI